MDKKILITGSNGFIGTNLTRYLAIQENISVYAMILKGTDESSLDDVNCTKVYGNLLDKEGLVEIFQDMDIIIHLAGLVTEWGPKEAFMKIIFEGTRNVLDAMREANVPRIVYMSSATIHGFENFQEAKEDTAANPYNAYAFAKHKAEELINQYHQDYGLETIIIRPAFVIYGEYDQNSFVNYLEALSEQKTPYLNKGKARSSFVYVQNLVEAIAFLSLHEEAHGPYNIVDYNTSWRDFIEDVCSIGGFSPPKRSIPYWLAYSPIWILTMAFKLFRAKKSPIMNLYRLKIQKYDLTFSSEKLHGLGFKPSHSKAVGIKNTIKWYVQHNKE